MQFEKLTEAFSDLDDSEVFSILEEVMLDGGTAAVQALEACLKGVEEIQNRYDAGEYFQGDMIYMSEILIDSVKKLKSGLIRYGEPNQSKPKVLICTVEYDLIDSGKNIVSAILDASGFNVLDLGKNIPKGEICKAAKENDIRIIALSIGLPFVLTDLKETISYLHTEIPDCKIIIGGRVTSAEICEDVGADEWAHPVSKTVNTCKKWSDEINKQQ